MPRRLIKRLLPDHSKVREHKHLRRFGVRLHDPNLWHLNRFSVSGATAAGLFAAFIPLPVQFIFAASLAIAFRVNLPIALSLTLVTNPLTMVPMLYSSYKIGTWILRIPPEPIQFQATSEWLARSLGSIWEPLLLGSLVIGSVSAVMGYFLVRLVWRGFVVWSWRKRRQQREKRANRGQ